MLTIASIPLTQRLLQRWSSLLVTEQEPFFLTDMQRMLMPPDAFLLKRDEIMSAITERSWIDSYLSYAVQPEATWVALVPPTVFASLPAFTQTTLLRAQWELGRGQMYAWDMVAPLLPDTIVTNWAYHRRFFTEQGTYLGLDAFSWQQLPIEVRHRWLIRFVELQQAPYSVIRWEELPKHPTFRSATIRSLANQFASRSGPNCFATTLAALVGIQAGSEAISQLWLRAEPFLRSLIAQGFHEVTGIDPSDTRLTDGVLVWKDQNGQAQHACYVIGSGIALNKNSQAWYAPRHLVHVSDIINYWHDDPYHVAVYVR